MYLTGKTSLFSRSRFGDLEIAGLHMAAIEFKDDSHASSLALVEDGVAAFRLSGGEGNHQANRDKRQSDNQRSIVHKTSCKLSRPCAGKQASRHYPEIRLAMVKLFDRERLAAVAFQ